MPSSAATAAVEDVAGDATVALAAVLGAIGRELHDAAGLALAAQEAASPLLLCVPNHISISASSGLQRLDLLAQRLEGLATFVKALGETEGGEVRIDAVSATSEVLLADLAHRLSLSQAPHEVDHGGFELF